MKHIFIGDIHGKVDAVKKALDMDGKKIFVGDFIDSFEYDVEAHKKCYDLVFDAIDKGEAESIFGNHELSYLMPDKHRCSGYDDGRQLLMTHYGALILTKFKPYILLEKDLLVSHAGLSNQIWTESKLSMETLNETLQQWWPDLQSPMHNIGRARGGWYGTGGMFWCDFNLEFEAVTGLTQIFGHTRGKGIRCIKTETEQSYCIDCLDRDLQFLELDI